MPAAERGHKALGRAAAARHLSQLLAVLGLCTLALLEACRGGVSQARATLVTAGLAYAVQVRLLKCTCWHAGSRHPSACGLQPGGWVVNYEVLPAAEPCR